MEFLFPGLARLCTGYWYMEISRDIVRNQRGFTLLVFRAEHLLESIPMRMTDYAVLPGNGFREFGVFPAETVVIDMIVGFEDLGFHLQL